MVCGDVFDAIDKLKLQELGGVGTDLFQIDFIPCGKLSKDDCAIPIRVKVE